MAMLPEPYASQDTLRLTLAYFVLASQEVLNATEKWDRKGMIDWVYNSQVTPDAVDPGPHPSSFSFPTPIIPSLSSPYSPSYLPFPSSPAVFFHPRL